jgi:hypothetical protein
MGAEEPEGITLTYINWWLSQHRGHPVVMARRRAQRASVIVTALECQQCGSGPMIRTDESDRGDADQLERVLR